MATDESDLYTDLLRLKPDDMTLNRWASAAGVSRTVWNDMRRHGNPTRRTLEKLLGAAGSSLAEFEALRTGARVGRGGEDRPVRPYVSDHSAAAWRAAPLQPLPLFEARPAATSEQPSLIAIEPVASAETIACPPGLSGDRRAFALNVAEESMWPRFRLGRRLLISPAATVAAGDDVLVRLAAGLALVKELAALSDRSLTLRQFNPDRTFAVSCTDVLSVEKIVGEVI